MLCMNIKFMISKIWSHIFTANIYYYNVMLFHFLAKGKEQSNRRHHLLGGVSRTVFIIVNCFYFQPAHTHILL